jgi:hypothetical protein
LLLDEDKEAAESEAKETGKPVVYKPTVGECPDGYFVADQKTCIKASRRVDCEDVGKSGGFNGGRTVDGRGAEEASCAAVPSAGPTVYVYDPKDRMFTLNLRFLTPVRTGKATVTITSGGASVGSGTGDEGKEFVVSVKNVKEMTGLNVVVEVEKPYTPYTGAPEYRAVLVQYESRDGARVGRVDSSITAVNGVGRDSDGILKNLRKYGTYSSSKIILLPRPNGASNLQADSTWMWVAGGGPTLRLDLRVPGTFLNPVYSEDRAVAPTGALITKKETLTMLRASPCAAADQKPGKYSLACLRNLFAGAGGDLTMGTLSRDGLESLNRIGDGREETIRGYLDDLYAVATKGKRAGGMKASITEINDAAMKLFGFEIVSPCEDIVENERGEIGLVPKVGALDADCLDYLWTNTGNDRSRGFEDRGRNTSLKNTYVSIGDRFSGLRTGEGSAAESARTPFATCQRSGSLAPKDGRGRVNDVAVAAANAKGSLTAIQDYYNSVYKTANFAGGNNDRKSEHVLALNQCYGVQRSGSDVTGPVSCPKPPPMMLLEPGRRLSMSPASNTFLYARHAGFVMWTHRNDGGPLFRNDATFVVRAGLGGTPETVSLVSVNFPAYSVVHTNFRIQIYPVGQNLTWNGREPGKQDAEWYVRPALNGRANAVSFEARSYGKGWYIGKAGDQVRLVEANNYNKEDLSWVIQTPLA